MKIHVNIIYTILSILIGFIPISVSAATVYLESTQNTISVGDTVIVIMKINTEGVIINTVEGDIAIKSGGTNVAIKEFSLANSAFGMWPRTPSLSNNGQVVSFVGGVPGGFNIEGATLFKIILEAKKDGRVTITPQNIMAFSNDGKGTKVPVSTKELVINVEPKKSDTIPNDEWTSLVVRDAIPPESFIIVFGQDASLFNGKKFAYFSTLDNQSGISYYEVRENGAPAVRTGSIYVLQNQDGDAKLSVTAFDKAGNKRTSEYPITQNSPLKGVSWPSVIFWVIGILIIVWFYKKFRKGKKNVSNIS